MKRGKQGEGGGAPPKYENGEQVMQVALEYFKICTEARTIPNKAGLRIALHISRDTYNEYKKRFPDALKGIEDYIEDRWLSRLEGNAPTGAIFYLKNAFKEDYQERSHVSLTNHVPTDDEKDAANKALEQL